MSTDQSNRWGALDDAAIAEARALMNVPLRRDRMQWVEAATRDAVRQFAEGVGDDNPLWVDPPMFFEGNPLLMETNNVFFLHMILANSDSGRAMTLGHTVLVTDNGYEPLSRSPLQLTVNS